MWGCDLVPRLCGGQRWPWPSYCAQTDCHNIKNQGQFWAGFVLLNIALGELYFAFSGLLAGKGPATAAEWVLRGAKALLKNAGLLIAKQLNLAIDLMVGSLAFVPHGLQVIVDLGKVMVDFLMVVTTTINIASAITDVIAISASAKAAGQLVIAANSGNAIAAMAAGAKIATNFATTALGVFAWPDWTNFWRDLHDPW